MVVRHCYEQQRKPEDAAEHGGRQRPLIDRDSENLEHGDANRHVGQGENSFHQCAPVPTLVPRLVPSLVSSLGSSLASISDSRRLSASSSAVASSGEVGSPGL